MFSTLLVVTYQGFLTFCVEMLGAAIQRFAKVTDLVY